MAAPALVARRSRWPGFLQMLAGAIGFALVVAALRDGVGIAWSKVAFVELSTWVAQRPGWAPEVAADLAVLTRPTLLCLVGGTVVLGSWARGGAGAGLRAAMLFAVAYFALMALLASYAAPGEGFLGWVGTARFPAAPVFWAVLVWGRLFGVLGGAPMAVLGGLVGIAAGAGRVAVGDDAPVDAVAGVFAAIAVWGLARWAVPGRR
ncbi:hypothetical protein GXW79_21070 [Roseomonas arctica]|uniref:Uncharacterized protein n=1 Tax=Plastoroseomonas arctica TaxID=1509237 RepID=A0AAF1K0A2_9PROT|nr:hypothetical protein [Plastoroseomonas arctica]